MILVRGYRLDQARAAVQGPCEGGGAFSPWRGPVSDAAEGVGFGFASAQVDLNADGGDTDLPPLPG
jgi:hypothetical protein